jgi:iron complex transport system substrate-binding protein
MFFSIPQGPKRIICLTEETTEWLYLLGEQDRIVGISGYTVRPPQARLEKPKVSAFLSAKLDSIVSLKPDMVFGFSDLQADIAQSLIRLGIPVLVFNQRSVADIFDMLFQVASLVNQTQKGLQLITEIQNQMTVIQTQTHIWARKPRVYFEEWDNPPISAIAWVSELIGIAGGENCFSELSTQPLGKNRIIHDSQEIIRRNPDIIIGSWCGKKFNVTAVTQRDGWNQISAVKHQQLFEIKSPIILQPGPAALTEGLKQLHHLMAMWVKTFKN